MNTPWGKAVNKVSLMRGITWVDTPAHGGFMVSKAFAEKHFDPYVLTLAGKYSNYYAFEEDVLWSILVLELDYLDDVVDKKKIVDLFPKMKTWKELHKQAREVASRYYPDYFEFVVGQDGNLDVTAFKNGLEWFKKYTQPVVNEEIIRTNTMIEQYEDYISRLKAMSQTKSVLNKIESANHMIANMQSRIDRFRIWEEAAEAIR